MSFTGLLEAGLFIIAIAVITKPLGIYMAEFFSGGISFLAPVERVIYRLSAVNPEIEQRWTGYAVAVLLFNLAGMLLLYFLERMQGFFPLNPQGLGAVPQDLAFNTAASFTTNTNWQAYAPETTVSYFTQMAGLAVQNFVSAATGLAVALALIRGLTRRSADTLGNFWVDLVRGILYLLLPVSIVFSLVLVWQGVPQNFSSYVQAQTLEGATQTIAQGPVGSQEIIKMFGINGGGFFNANSAHPYENPTPVSNFFEMVAIFAIPAGLTYTFGRMAGDTRQGWALWAAMGVLFLLGLIVAWAAEQAGNPLFMPSGVDQSMSSLQSGGNMEGKEVRFGMAGSMLFTVLTTDASCGAVNNMHDSLMPLSGLVAMVNMQLGEVIFGGVGAGLYGILIFAILAVFIAGLMVGRTPEYLGKKIESYQIKMAMLVVLVLGASILALTAAASVSSAGTSSILNPGPHGFSEILYAYTSGTANNGSAFAGLAANTLFYDVTIAFATLMGRFFMIVPILAIAGSMARKQAVPPSLGTFPTYGTLWVGLLVGVVLIVGALTYFPALALGPVVEQLLLQAGQTF